MDEGPNRLVTVDIGPLSGAALVARLLEAIGAAGPAGEVAVIVNGERTLAVVMPVSMAAGTGFFSTREVREVLRPEGLVSGGGLTAWPA